jgi:lysophospholipase L1-like esterase
MGRFVARLLAAAFIGISVLAAQAGLASASQTSSGNPARPASGVQSAISPSAKPKPKPTSAVVPGNHGGASFSSGYTIIPGFDQQVLPANDDGSTGLVQLPFVANFYGTYYEALYINNNGNLTFSQPLSQYTPQSLNQLGIPMIAPFWSDVDTRVGNQVTYGYQKINGHWALGVDYINVGCYYENDTVTDTFQVVLIDRSDIGPGDWQIDYNYGPLTWDSGQASGGNGQCLGGSAARAGYTSGAGESCELPGSGVDGGLLNTNTISGLDYHSFNSNNIDGRYIFDVSGTTGDPDGCGAYFALGDSYSSGEGTDNYDYQGPPCDRGSGAWPSLMAQEYPAVPSLTGATFIACSGDKTYQILNGRSGEPSPQATVLKDWTISSGPPGLVTVTAGGDDLGFAPILETCVKWGLIGDNSHCLATLRAAEAEVNSSAFLHTLVRFYNTIAQDAGGTDNVVVVGYPNLFPLPSFGNDVGAALHCALWLRGNAPSILNEFAIGQTDLNGTIALAAAEAGVRYVELGDLFSGHELCTGDAWINALRPFYSGAGHPNAAGQQAIASYVAAQLGYLAGNGSGAAPGLRRQATGKAKHPGTGGSAEQAGAGGTIKSAAATAGRIHGTTASTARPAAPTSITLTGTLPDGGAGIDYEGFLIADGGTDPYTWAVTSGSLPAGLSMDPSTGIISGVPTTAGTSTFTVTVTDSSSPAQSTSVSESIAIAGTSSLAVSSTALPGPTVGQAYSATLTATGGVPAYTWSVSSGTLPAGLSLDPNTGIISGTPSTAGTSTFTVQAADSSSQSNPATAAATLTLTVAASTASLTLAPPALPGGTQGGTYTYQLPSTGGTAPLAWSVTSGALPSGLSLDPTTGVISGIATAAGTFPFAISVSDAASHSATESLSITIAAGSAPSITTTALPDATAGTAYSRPLAGSGGVAPYTWSVTSGALPTGLNLDVNNGIISGTATTAGTYTFGVTLTDSATPSAQTATASYTMTVDAAPPPPAMTVSDTVTSGTVGSPYVANLIPANGVSPYTYAVTSGALPNGLTLDPNLGTVSGTPTATGTFTATITATDSSTPTALTATDTVTITIAAPGPLTVTTTSLPAASLGAPYTAPLDVTGGTGADTFAVTSGALPAGLTLDPASGIIYGTPTATGPSTFTVTVTDSATPTADTTMATLTLTVGAASPVTIATTTLPAAEQGIAYSKVLSATGGAPPYTWSVSSGTLPDGLSLNSSTGVISGTPTSSGPYTFTVQVTDSLAPTPQTATQSYTLTVNASSHLAITTTALNPPTATQGTSYSGTALDASGGTGPYTWSVSSGALPNGLTLDPVKGIITGTPTGSGAYSFTVQVTDSSTPTAQTATESFTMTVAAGPPLAITTTTLPAATQGVYYVSTVATSGGVAPLTWSVSSGSLPAGLSLDNSGDISGTPTGSGTSTFTIQATDSSTPTPQTASQSYTLTVTAPLAITTTSLPAATQGTAYTATVAASGGTTPYTWSVSSGSLPAGLTLDPSSGTISGTPTGSGTASFTVEVTDSSTPTPQTATQTLSIAVAPQVLPQTISFTAPSSGTVGGTATLAATGGGSGNPVVFTVGTSSGAGVCAVSGTNGTTLHYMAVGNCVIDANQAGNANYNPAPQVQRTIPVGKASQSISFTAPSSGTAGGTATLAATGGGSGNPVVFTVGTSSGAGVCAVSGTHGSTLTYAKAGSCVIDANQAGNANYNPAPQVQRTIQVAKAASKTTLTISATSVAWGHEKAITFTVKVAPQSAATTLIPTGTVTVAEGTKTLCAGTLVNGKATCTPGSATQLTPGTYSVVGAYAGSGAFASSASSAVTLKVVKEPTKATLALSASSITYGREKSLIVTATVTSQYSGIPAGTVTITAGSVTLCKNKPLARNGKATCSPAANTTLRAGTYSVVAKYSGNADYAAATSPSKTLKVVKVATPFVLALAVAITGQWPAYRAWNPMS